MGKVDVETKILSKNDIKAAELREKFKNTCVLNFVSSPGSGKTSILEKILGSFKDKYKVAVIEGDQQTTNDADRIEATGVTAFQVNTGQGCHLEATDVEKGMAELGYDLDLLIIENVGNLVCPSQFDLGEDAKVIVLSTTEGADKPAKYPVMFHVGSAFIINKTDLLPYVDFDVEQCEEYAKGVNPELEVFKTSCKTGEGLNELTTYIERMIKAKKG
ncbi:hydrogenase accessory protein HypB [Denitrovibrio acetiphilus DSM 12809]|uniref:Hydrogenase accessory protein HypB n=1 Tax=Denitrovibrio acetiphilus (strain DSM 12809 / NBRC 114555 / N2460) TaxID=522772 RepID=D4H3S3_DENA2|nr:hydrogenase nickel incorporation protein HypB [Denitrovibrio acetiphilus]ADD69175.1 hydrogenase accessory protein HypB [Denitrovibrio acetiphilus DSM 12809]